MVRERASGGLAPDRDHGPALPAGLPHRQRAGEYARVRASLRLQGRPEDGKSQRLPRLVIDGE